LWTSDFPVTENKDTAAKKTHQDVFYNYISTAQMLCQFRTSIKIEIKCTK